MPNGLNLWKSGVISSSGAFKAQSVGVVWGHLETLIKVTPWFARVCEWRALMFDCPDLYLAMSSAKPYIGCKIGLISKAQNRYEGILYTIDRGNSTVVLAKGECFGTMIVSMLKIFFNHFMVLKNHFNFMAYSVFCSQVFWNRGSTHRQTNTTQRWYLWLYHIPWKWH